MKLFTIFGFCRTLGVRHQKDYPTLITNEHSLLKRERRSDTNQKIKIYKPYNIIRNCPIKLFGYIYIKNNHSFAKTQKIFISQLENI